MATSTLYHHLKNADRPGLAVVMTDLGQVSVTLDGADATAPQLIGTPDAMRALGLAILDAVVVAKAELPGSA